MHESNNNHSSENFSKSVHEVSQDPSECGSSAKVQVDRLVNVAHEQLCKASGQNIKMLENRFNVAIMNDRSCETHSDGTTRPTTDNQNAQTLSRSSDSTNPRKASDQENLSEENCCSEELHSSSSNSSQSSRPHNQVRSVLTRLTSFLSRSRPQKRRTRFVGAISVPNLSSLTDHECVDHRSHSDPSMDNTNHHQQHSQSIAFGLNTIPDDASNPRVSTLGTVFECDQHDSQVSTSDSINSSKCSFQKHTKHGKPRPSRFEPKTEGHVAPIFAPNPLTTFNTLPSNRSTKYSSCLCLSQSPNTFASVSTSSTESPSPCFSSMATLPVHTLPNGPTGPGMYVLDPNLRYRYLTYGTSAQLQQEYGKVLPWPTLTEFRLRRKFRRLKRRARKLIGVNLFSSKSFKRLMKRRNSHDSGQTSNTSQSDEVQVAAMSRSSSLTSLLELIENANKNLINSFNESPGPAPKCPPRLKRAQSSVNMALVKPETVKLTEPRKPVVTIPEELLAWKPNMDDYQIAFIERALANYQLHSSPAQQSKNLELDSISVKSLDSYFGPSPGSPKTEPNAPDSEHSPQMNAQTHTRIAQSSHPTRSSRSKMLCVRSHFEVNNGTVYLEDSDWEMCSEISELNSLNLIESQGLDTVSMAATVISDMQQNLPSKASGARPKKPSRMECSSVSLQSSISSDGVESVTTEKKPIVADVTPSEETKFNNIESKSTLTVVDSEQTCSVDTEEEHQYESFTPVVNQQQTKLKEDTTVVSVNPSPSIAEDCHIYSVPIKKPKRVSLAENETKPEPPPKPTTLTTNKSVVKQASKLCDHHHDQCSEPIYAKPIKSKYPPKHCCIARPAQPPPPQPNRPPPLKRTSKRVTLRKKAKAPAPPPPVSKTITSSATQSLSDGSTGTVRPVSKASPKIVKPIEAGRNSSKYSPGNNPSSVRASTISSAAKVTHSPTDHKLRLNNLIRKNVGGKAVGGGGNKGNTKAVSKSKQSNSPKSPVTNVSHSTTITLPPTDANTECGNHKNTSKNSLHQCSSSSATRSTSKSPFKALIDRLNPRNQGKEGHHRHQEEVEEASVDAETDSIKESKEKTINTTENSDVIDQAIAIDEDKCTEPIYSNTSIETEHFGGAEQHNSVGDLLINDQPNANTTDLNQSVVSVNDLIDKFNKLQTPESTFTGVEAQIPMFNSDNNSHKQLNNVRFESLLSNQKNDNTNSPNSNQNLEGQFQEYFYQMKHSNFDQCNQKQLIEQLCSELMRKLDQQSQCTKEETTTQSRFNSNNFPSLNGLDANSETQINNPNWLFMFFLHNQRQMFKEILHEMFASIQKNQHQQVNQFNKFKESPQEESIVKSEELNEFKKLIQTLQSTINTNTQPNELRSDSHDKDQIQATSNETPIFETIVSVEPEQQHKTKAIKMPKIKLGKKFKKNSNKSKEKTEEASVESEVKSKSSVSDSEKVPGNSSSVQSSNRFVNKIVLNNSINQFNFTMSGQENGQSVSPTTTAPNTASIVNVFADNTTNQSANMFDVNVGNGDNNGTEHTEPDQSSESEDSAPENEASGCVSVQVLDSKQAPMQHRTVLQIKDASGRSSSSSGLFSTLRYRLEKKRNKKLMERFKKQQLAASQVSLLDAIQEAAELGNDHNTPKVTLANTSTLEVKVNSSGESSENIPPTVQSQPKMGTLRRLLSPSRGGAATGIKDKKTKQSEENYSSDNLSEQRCNNQPVTKLNQLVERHRNSRYVPSVSEPYPTGPVEYSLFGTIRRGQKIDHKNSERIGRRGRIPDQMIDYHPKPVRSLSERNFRSISVIKLNEEPVVEEPLTTDQSDFDFGSQSDFQGSRVSLSSSSAGHYYRSRGASVNGGSQLSLSQSIAYGDYFRGGRHESGRSDYHRQQCNARNANSRVQSHYDEHNDDHDDETSTTSSRSKMVTFTLPRSFRPRSKTSNGGGVGQGGPFHHRRTSRAAIRNYRFNEMTGSDTALNNQTTTDDDELDHNHNYEYSNRNQPPVSETECEDSEFGSQYYLAPCRLNQRYFQGVNR